MDRDDQIVHTSVYLPRKLLTKLRQRLIGEGTSLSAWFREQAEAHTRHDDR